MVKVIYVQNRGLSLPFESSQVDDTVWFPNDDAITCLQFSRPQDTQAGSSWRTVARV
jgi:hypothetical protein